MATTSLAFPLFFFVCLTTQSSTVSKGSTQSPMFRHNPIFGTWFIEVGKETSFRRIKIAAKHCANGQIET
jgi:hypothetical protein